MYTCTVIHKPRQATTLSPCQLHTHTKMQITAVICCTTRPGWEKDRKYWQIQNKNKNIEKSVDLSRLDFGPCVCLTFLWCCEMLVAVNSIPATTSAKYCRGDVYLHINGRRSLLVPDRAKLTAIINHYNDRQANPPLNLWAEITHPGRLLTQESSLHIQYQSELMLQILRDSILTAWNRAVDSNLFFSENPF